MNIDVNAEVQSALPALLAQLRDELAERVASECRAAAMVEVNKAAKEWAIANLVPEIKAQLEAGKDGFLAAANEVAKRLGAVVTDALVKEAEEQMKQSWNRREIAKKLFGG